jgi:hypothetical protein
VFDQNYYQEEHSDYQQPLKNELLKNYTQFEQKTDAAEDKSSVPS